jgi:hypothetical protein
MRLRSEEHAWEIAPYQLEPSSRSGGRLRACLTNRQRSAGTTRVHQAGHARAHAGIGDTSRTSICSRNMLAGARPCPSVPPLNFHGKEGVDGSSPSEGFRKGPHIGHLCPLIWHQCRSRGHKTDTSSASGDVETARNGSISERAATLHLACAPAGARPRNGPTSYGRTTSRGFTRVRVGMSLLSMPDRCPNANFSSWPTIHVSNGPPSTDLFLARVAGS